MYIKIFLVYYALLKLDEMFTGSMMKLKSILYGTLPFYYTKVFEPSSPKLAYYDYFRKRGYTRYPL